MSDDQLDLFGCGDAPAPWMPTTPAGREPAREYELFLALRPDLVGDESWRASVEQLQQRYRTATSKTLRPSLWHVTLLELVQGKFTGSYPRASMDALQAACDAVLPSLIQVAHQSLVCFQPSGACVLTCSTDTNQAIAKLRQDLLAAFRARGVKCKAAATSHMTLFYDPQLRLPTTPLDEPLAWSADGFSLLCSHKGLGYHEPVRRWPEKR